MMKYACINCIHFPVCDITKGLREYVDRSRNHHSAAITTGLGTQDTLLIGSEKLLAEHCHQYRKK